MSTLFVEQWSQVCEPLHPAHDLFPTSMCTTLAIERQLCSIWNYNDSCSPALRDINFSCLDYSGVPRQSAFWE